MSRFKIVSRNSRILTKTGVSNLNLSETNLQSARTIESWGLNRVRCRLVGKERFASDPIFTAVNGAQKLSFTANWISRGLLLVEVMRPKSPTPPEIIWSGVLIDAGGRNGVEIAARICKIYLIEEIKKFSPDQFTT